MSGSTTQHNGHNSSLGQDVANLKGALHLFCTVELTSCSRTENAPGFGGMARGQWLSYLINIMASVFHGEEVLPERIQPISTLKLHFQPCSCKREASPVLHYLKASNSVAEAPEGPLIILKGSMKGNYEKIRYRGEILRDLHAKKKRLKITGLGCCPLLPSLKPLLAKYGNAFNDLQK